MSSIWVHKMGKDFYSYFDTIEEAYFTAKNITRNPIKYLTMVNWLNEHSTVMIDSDQSIGQRAPPVSQNYFPHGLMYVKKTKYYKSYLETYSFN